MKKLMTITAVALLLITSTAFAGNGPDVNAKVKAAFEKHFSNARDVSWQTKEGFYFASFSMDNSKADAAYNENGDLLATSRNIKPEQFPLVVSLALNEKYAGYSVANNSTEVTLEKQTRYYVTVANEKQILHLNISAAGDITVEEKTKR